MSSFDPASRVARSPLYQSSPIALRISYFAASKRTVELAERIAILPQLFKATEAVFRTYNILVEPDPPLPVDLAKRVLGVEGEVRAQRSFPKEGHKPNKEQIAQRSAYLNDSLQLRLASYKLGGNDTTRLSVIFCVYDYKDDELKNGKVVEGETFPSLKPEDAPRWVLINVRIPPSFWYDPAYKLLIAHEAVHAAGAQHNLPAIEKGLLNEGGGDGLVLTTAQIDALKKAPFCGPPKK